MHHLLPLKIKVWIIVGLAALVSGVTSWLGLHPVAIGTIVGIVEFVLLFLLSHSWRWVARIPYLPRPAWMSVDLTGKWTGAIRSQWGNGANEDIPATVNVQQRWQDVVFNVETERMRSRSFGAIPTYDPAGRTLQFRYFFETVPMAASVAANPPQQLGCALAYISLEDPNRMTIRYTNERGLGGDILLSRRSRRR
jgi:hypothetical protein